MLAEPLLNFVTAVDDTSAETKTPRPRAQVPPVPHGRNRCSRDKCRRQLNTDHHRRYLVSFRLPLTISATSAVVSSSLLGFIVISIRHLWPHVGRPHQAQAQFRPSDCQSRATRSGGAGGSCSILALIATHRLGLDGVALARTGVIRSCGYPALGGAGDAVCHCVRASRLDLIVIRPDWG